MSLKILLVSSLYAPNVLGGAEKVAQLLAEKLAEYGHQITVLTTQPEGSRRKAFINGVDVRYLPVRNLYHPFKRSKYGLIAKAIWHFIDSSNPWMANEVGRLLDDLKPDIVHSHAIAAFSPQIWREAYVRSIPVVHTLHDYYLNCPRATMFKRGMNCIHPCMTCAIYSAPRKYLSRYVSGVIGVSSHILNTHLEEGHFSRAWIKEVIFNANAVPIRMKPDNHDHSFRFGFLGRLVPTKGIEHLIDAFSRLPHGQAELWVGGTGDERYLDELRNRAKGASVRWLGYVKPNDLIDNVDVFVLPSLWNDPAPLVAQEAMARGVPVIAANNGGIPELVDKGGWIYDPSSPDELHLLLHSVLDTPELLSNVGRVANERAKSFKLVEWLNKHEVIYKNLMAFRAHGAR